MPYVNDCLGLYCHLCLILLRKKKLLQTAGSGKMKMRFNWDSLTQEDHLTLMCVLGPLGTQSRLVLTHKLQDHKDYDAFGTSEVAVTSWSMLSKDCLFHATYP
ncbi:hypothetical protein F0562_020909 [Nyssa sinensis]|uniref:Uncharacterized protein n=1 Tax=Nyssa sinensis TaxID=561372 RepID=A0A5J5BU88_9ASTE|nr:hypothetical protein F0562_020909 [Nyssa sinensis]